MGNVPVQSSYFVILLSFAIDFLLTQAYPCWYHKNIDQYSKVTPFHREMCYFIVKGSTSMLNHVTGDSGMFTFNATEARALCHQNNATLPFIRNEEQETFIVNNFLGKDFGPPITSNFPSIAIGLNVVPVEKGDEAAGIDPRFKWDDGSDLVYKPKQKKNWFWDENPLYAEIKYDKEKKVVTWTIVPKASIPSVLPVGVVCSYNYTDDMAKKGISIPPEITTTMKAPRTDPSTTVKTSTASAFYPYGIPFLICLLISM